MRKHGQYSFKLDNSRSQENSRTLPAACYNTIQDTKLDSAAFFHNNKISFQTLDAKFIQSKFVFSFFPQN